MNFTKIFGFPENLMIDVKNESPEFDTVLMAEDAIITKRVEVFENIIDFAKVDGVLNDIEAVTIPEETLENNLDDPNAKIIGDIEAVSIKEEVFENISNEVNEKTVMDSNDNFDQEAEWSKLIKPCYLKLVKIDQQIQIPQIAKKTGQKSDHCSNKFDRKSDLKVQERVHARKYPYSCKTCNKSFNKFRSLKTHESIHTGEKPYTCRYCSNTFRV